MNQWRNEQASCCRLCHHLAFTKFGQEPLDVHKKTVMASRVTPDPTGQRADGIIELQEFGTITRDLLALSDWLAEVGATHVAMESIGEY